VLAEAVVSAILAVDPGLICYGLSGSVLLAAARAAGLRVAAEVFADRSYQSDGSLTPRSKPGALIADEETALAQVLRMAAEGRVRSTGGTDVPLSADTVCLHGDGPDPVAFARRLRLGLGEAGIEVRAPCQDLRC